MTTVDLTAIKATMQAETDANEARGFKGAVVDPNPNSAYSQETDPMTSPGAGDQRGSQRFIIDEYADPANPYSDEIHDRKGLVEDSAEDVANENVVVETTIVARTAAATGTKTIGTAKHDGTVASCKIVLDDAVAADAVNFRTFTVRNVTKGLDAFVLSTSATPIAADVEVTVPANGAATNRDASLDDEFALVETVTGTGQAHSAGSIKFTSVQAAA